MRRRLPSTRALLVFDAVARHHGVGKAADALCLTHGAVSQQLRLLEAQLGVRLVQRTAHGSQLTDAGRRYHAQIAGDLLRLENHTLEAMAQRPDGTSLLVGAVPAFAERWLLPRIPAFTALQPGCSVHLQIFPTCGPIENAAPSSPGACQSTERLGCVPSVHPLLNEYV